jgi:ParB family chromosome partitioning protein
VAERRGLGRGLGAILPEASGGPDMRELPIELVKPNPGQPRKRFEEEPLAALASSIGASGLVQPLLVRALSDGSYELIAGERRWRAAQMAGLDKVPVVVRDSDEADRLEVALIENMVREDLNPVEEARACAELVEELGLSKEELGRRIGRSRPQISNLIRLLDLPDEVIEMLEREELSEGHGRAILQVSDHDRRRHLARLARDHGWSVRKTEEQARATEAPQAAPARPKISAEEKEAISELAERLETGLGLPVVIRPKSGGLSVEIRVEDIEQASGLADKLG